MQISGTVAHTALLIVTLSVWGAVVSDPFGGGSTFAPPGVGFAVDLPLDCRLRHSNVRPERDGSVAWSYEFIVPPDDIVTVSGTTCGPAKDGAHGASEFLYLEWTENVLTVVRKEMIAIGGRSALRVYLAGKVGGRNVVGTGLLADGPRGPICLDCRRIAEDATPHDMATGMPADFIGSFRFIDASATP